MKKPLIWILAIAIALVGIGAYVKSNAVQKKTIAIVTTLSHPALDQVRLGFIEAVNGLVDEHIELAEYNAEGNVQQANLIAQKIASDKSIIGILAIGTLAAQTLAKAEKTRPIVITAVSDPKVLPQENSNICGLSDAISSEYQIDTLLKMLPNLKSVALLYSPNEANSAAMVENLAKSIEKRAIKANLVGIHEPQHIMPGSINACKNNDAVLIPLDNQLVASMPAVIKATRDLPCPIITSNESPIHQGATIAFGVDYRKSGYDAGEIIGHILKGATDPKKVGFVDPQSLGLYVNDHVMLEKNLTIALESLDHVVHTKGDING